MGRDRESRGLDLPYERSARLGAQWWLMLAVGLAFVWAGFTVDPQDNCGENGECAPWLVPLGAGLGLLFAGGAAAHLLANPRSGSMIDPATGELVWWQGRTRRHAGDGGRIDPRRIARIRIVRESEGPDGVSLLDAAGERIPFFDHAVIPLPYERWAQAFAARWPHVELEIG